VGIRCSRHDLHRDSNDVVDVRQTVGIHMSFETAEHLLVLIAAGAVGYIVGVFIRRKR
jgi:hypothetical protein